MQATPGRYQGVVKKIDPRDTYNRLGIEVPGTTKWMWVSYFGNLHPQTAGASIAFDLAVDSKDRPYISEYNVLEQGFDNPPLNRSTPNAAPQGNPRPAPAPTPAPQPEKRPPTRGVPQPFSTDALLEFVSAVGLKYAELGEGDSLDDCFGKAAELAMKLDAKLTAYRRNGLMKPTEPAPAPRPSNPAAIAEQMAKRATGAQEEPPPADEPTSRR